MSGLLALLDDVAAIAKIAATQVDDVVGQASQVGAKAAGVVIDDAAVAPKYVTGLPATRELPIVWKIARASVFNKLVILLPIALVLNTFAPWVLTPLLMLGGSYLCFEGAEKIWHALSHHPASHTDKGEALSAAHLEEQRVRGAIKTDFILSAEIMTISLTSIESGGVVSSGLILAMVAIGITALVYGAVALLVKMDDVGLKLSQVARLAAVRSLGVFLVKAMPVLLTIISVVGTAAMLWVGGSILVHGVEALGWHWPYATIHHLGEAAAQQMGPIAGVVHWLVTATCDGVLGLSFGALLIPIVTRTVVPMTAWIAARRKAASPSNAHESGSQPPASNA